MNFAMEVSDLERIVTNFEDHGVNTYAEIGNKSCANDELIWEKEIGRGNYLLKMMGVYLNSSGNATIETLRFLLSTSGN